MCSLPLDHCIQGTPVTASVPSHMQPLSYHYRSHHLGTAPCCTTDGSGGAFRLLRSCTAWYSRSDTLHLGVGQHARVVAHGADVTTAVIRQPWIGDSEQAH